MPKDRNFNINIPKAYRRQTIDNWMFGYVLGLQTAFPGMKLVDIIGHFSVTFNISEDEYSREAMLQNWYRMYNDIITIKFNENGKKER